MNSIDIGPLMEWAFAFFDQLPLALKLVLGIGLFIMIVSAIVDQGDRQNAS